MESDITINMAIARFTTLRTDRSDSYSIAGVLSHEIGNMIGPGHVANETWLMKHRSSAAEFCFKGKIDPLTIAAYRSLFGDSARHWPRLGLVLFPIFGKMTRGPHILSARGLSEDENVGAQPALSRPCHPNP